MSNMLDELKGSATAPAIEIFKVGPETTEDFISKLLVVMGAEVTDIQHISITNDRKKLRISAILEKDSEVFHQRNANPVSNLSLLGAGAPDDVALSDRAKNVLREFGYFYKKYDDDDEDDDGRDVYMCSIEENKKNVEIEFNEEVTMAIITDSNFNDEYFIVDAVEEVVRKKSHDRKKFKGKKKTVIFARVHRSYQSDEGFSPEQVAEFQSGTFDDEDEEDED